VLYKSKNRLILSGLLAAAIACTATLATAVAAAPSNVAAWVKNAPMVGTAPGSKSVVIAVHMALSNGAELKSLATAVSTPNGAEYGHYLTSEELASRYAPASADVAAVKALLEGAGMSHVQVGPLGAYVTAAATVDQLRRTFHVSQNLYSYGGKTLRANKEEPTLPASLTGKVLFVEGLDDSALLRHPYHRSAVMKDLVSPAAATPAGARAITPPPVAAGNPSPYCNQHFGSGTHTATLSTAADVYGGEIPWLDCGYTPQQIQEAYGLNKVRSYDGSGVRVAIVDAYASPTLLADANRYAANHGLPALVLGANFHEFVPAGIYNVNPNDPCGPYGWWEEQSLDVAAVHGAAPGATIIFVGSLDCNTSLDTALQDTIYDHRADVVTNSYGYNGESIAPGQQASDDQALMAGAALGMTVLFSSGDDGDLSQDNGVASGSWPATSAWTTGVGGTSLFYEEAGAKTEYGWGNYRDYLDNVTVLSEGHVQTTGLETTTAYGYTFDAFAFYAGAGGGVSILESQPSYQASTVPVALSETLNLASGYTEPLPTPHRVSPDVAMDADPYTGYLFGETFTIAGNPISDHGCTPISSTEEYCENAIGGTSLASPLMAGVMAVVNQSRMAMSQPKVGFANPLLYGIGSGGNGTSFNTAPINQIIAPTSPVSVLRAYAADLNLARVVTISSVPFLISTTTPFALEVCGITVCYGIDDVFNFTSLSAYGNTPAGYNDVTGLGVPYVPMLISAK
jgi:subtilase family serine protease